MRNGAFPAVSVNKDVIVVSDSYPPGHSGRRRLPVIWQQEAAATPCGEHRGSSGCEESQDTGPR